MRTLTKRTELLKAVQPFLTSPNPLEALKQAGFTLSGDLSEFVDGELSAPIADPRLVEELRRVYGPPPPARISVRASGRPERPTVPSAESGYRAMVSGELGLLNDVLAELWRVRTIPN